MGSSLAFNFSHFFSIYLNFVGAAQHGASVYFYFNICWGLLARAAVSRFLRYFV